MMETAPHDPIGTGGVDDLEAILAVANTDPSVVAHVTADDADAIFSWQYEKGARPELARLYEKAKASQWNAETDLPWATPVDQEQLILARASAGGGPFAGMDLSGTPFASWGEAEYLRLKVENQNWTLSQFLHGEQGALLCTAKIVEAVPWIDAKYYAATQVMDEARHVEVFSRYLDTKLSGHYPINPHLQQLLDDILRDSRWDIAYLGMQIMVEGLALAAFHLIRELSNEPLLKEILRLVIGDEARHVAFGVLSLKEFYAQLSAGEIRERQEFAFEAAVRMRDRFLQQEVWERLGVSPRDALPLLLRSPERAGFTALLFSNIVPNCRRLGLLDAGDGWLRARFTELGVIHFETRGDLDPELGVDRLLAQN
ncbi:ferritin-like domain-containing protein [Candidatus Binatia bacterium]|nr:ferritin-like domain-containing protein [Candidatus Binatia bacterium]